MCNSHRGDRFHPDPIHITSLQTFGDKLNVLVLYVVLANELLHYEGLSAALASFGHVSQAALRTFGLPIFFALTALEFTVLNLSDIRLVSAFLFVFRMLCYAVLRRGEL